MPPTSTGGAGATQTGVMNLSIDGVPFTAFSVTAVRSTPGPEIVTIVGLSLSGSSATTISLTALAQVGAHQVAQSQVTQATLAVATGSVGSGFAASQSLGRGTITFTSLTATAVAGTVDLVLVPTSGATTNRTITGSFNVPFSTNPAAPAPSPSPSPSPTPGASTFSATIDGVSWTASGRVRAVRSTGGFITISGVDPERGVSMVVFATAPGTYPFNATSTNNALYSVGSRQWFTLLPGGSGSITLAAIDASRVSGTFTLTLVPGIGNSGPAVQITSGTFNVPFE